jgi:hypothetical protein
VTGPGAPLHLRPGRGRHPSVVPALAMMTVICGFIGTLPIGPLAPSGALRGRDAPSVDVGGPHAKLDSALGSEVPHIPPELPTARPTQVTIGSPTGPAASDPLMITSLTASPLAGTAPLAVTFSATVQDGPTAERLNVTWAWADGTNNSTQSEAVTAGNSVQLTPTSHTYTSPGTFRAGLTVGDGIDHKVSESISLTVTTPLSVHLVANPVAVTIGRPVSIHGDVTGGDPPYTYSWTLPVVGGCAVDASARENVTCVPESTGSPEVSLEVTDQAPSNQYANLNFTVNPRLTSTVNSTAWFRCVNGDALLQYNFSANAAGGTVPYSYSWNPGDGSANLSGNTTSHSFVVGASVNVSLTITDASGATWNRTLALPTLFGVCASTSPAPGIPRLLIAALLIVGAVVVILLVLLIRGRPPRAPKHLRAADPTDPERPSGPVNPLAPASSPSVGDTAPPG